MSFSVQTVINQARTTFKGMTEAQALDYLQDVDVIIQRKFKTRQKSVYLALTEDEPTADLVEGAVWVRRAYYWSKPDSRRRLEDESEDSMETDGSTGPHDSRGAPQRIYRTSNLSGSPIGLEPVPNKTTIRVTNATNATPIVVTVDAVHELADGDRADVWEVEGNTGANGKWYAKRTGYSTTTFALYEDSDLLVPVAGNGVYTASSGLIGCSVSPYIEAVVVWHPTLTSADTMPKTMLKPIYIDGVCFFHAKRMHLDYASAYKDIWEDSQQEQDPITNRRIGHKQRHLRVVQQRPAGYVHQRRLTPTQWD